MVVSTPDISQHRDPRDWRSHCFGLSPERWGALAGRAFWITGAGTGYGHALSAALAAADAEVFLSGRRENVLRESLAGIDLLGITIRRCHILPVDITDVAQVATAVSAIARHTRVLYGLVNNAAVPEPPGDWPLVLGDISTWCKIIDTNLTGSWFVTRAALPLLAKSPSMRVLFMSSEAGWASTPGFGPYNISKAALNSLCLCCAAEVAGWLPDRDVQINVIVPGEARTEMNRSSAESPFAVVPMALALLSHPTGGPNGRLFHRDGRHLAFGYAEAWSRPVTSEPDVRPNRSTPTPIRRDRWGAHMLRGLMKRIR